MGAETDVYGHGEERPCYSLVVLGECDHTVPGEVAFVRRKLEELTRDWLRFGRVVVHTIPESGAGQAALDWAQGHGGEIGGRTEGRMDWMRCWPKRREAKLFCEAEAGVIFHRASAFRWHTTVEFASVMGVVVRTIQLPTR